jgi:hypothetical protein
LIPDNARIKSAIPPPRLHIPTTLRSIRRIALHPRDLLALDVDEHYLE